MFCCSVFSLIDSLGGVPLHGVGVGEPDMRQRSPGRGANDTRIVEDSLKFVCRL